MDICTKFEDLKPLLMRGQESEDSTFSVVFIPKNLSAHDVVALRTAAKWCDVVIAVCLDEKFSTNQQKILKGAGVNILFISSQNVPQLSLDSGKVNSGFVLKVILAVVPSAVVVQIANVDLLKVILQINTNYPEMFTPIYSETPVHILSDAEQGVRQTLVAIQEIITGGEKNIKTLTAKLGDVLQQKSIHLNVCDYVDNQGVTCQKIFAKEGGFIHISAKIVGTYIQDGIQIRN
jgi:hypothetical protein